MWHTLRDCNIFEGIDKYSWISVQHKVRCDQLLSICASISFRPGLDVFLSVGILHHLKTVVSACDLGEVCVESIVHGAESAGPRGRWKKTAGFFIVENAVFFFLRFLNYSRVIVDHWARVEVFWCRLKKRNNSDITASCSLEFVSGEQCHQGAEKTGKTTDTNIDVKIHWMKVFAANDTGYMEWISQIDEDDLGNLPWPPRPGRAGTCASPGACGRATGCARAGATKARAGNDSRGRAYCEVKWPFLPVKGSCILTQFFEILNVFGYWLVVTRCT